nr:hypothetical protein [Tanacetum cinerariifolium]
MNGKSHTVNVKNFRDMLQIFPKLPDLVYQVEKKNSKNNNDMCYLRFTKVIIDYIIKKDLAIPKRNKMFWHTAKDDLMFTMLRVILKHQTTQIYNVILPKQLTNQAMIESEAYKTYYAYATGEKTPKPKYVQKKADFETSPKKKPVQASKGKRLKITAKVPKSGKKKLPAQGLETLSEIALFEAEQMKITTKRSRTQFYVSHANGSGAHEGTSFKLGVSDAPKYGYDDEQISWKSSDEDDDDEDTADDNADDEDDDGQDDDNE